MSLDLAALRTTAEQAAVAAGRILAEGRSGWRDTEMVDGRDIRIVADRRADAMIQDRLRPLGLPVLSEETGWVGGVRPAAGAPAWIIDPLDGSANYARGLALAAVCIALVAGERRLMGVVFDIGTGELLTGIPGQGAWLDGRPVTVSTVDRIDRAALVTGISKARNTNPEAMAAFGRFLAPWCKVRMMGAAALGLAQLASGRADAYCESSVRYWDVAAGLACVEGAGGRVILTGDAPDGLVNVTATNGRLAVTPHG